MDAELFKAVSAVLGCFTAINMISLFLIFFDFAYVQRHFADYSGYTDSKKAGDCAACF